MLNSSIHFNDPSRLCSLCSVRGFHLTVNNYKHMTSCSGLIFKLSLCDQKKLFSLTHSLFGSKKYHSVARIYQLFYFSIFNQHVFIEKIHKTKMEFPLLEACLPAHLFVDIDTIMPVCTAVFDHLTHFNHFLVMFW